MKSPSGPWLWPCLARLALTVGGGGTQSLVKWRAVFLPTALPFGGLATSHFLSPEGFRMGVAGVGQVEGSSFHLFVPSECSVVLPLGGDRM